MISQTHPFDGLRARQPTDAVQTQPRTGCRASIKRNMSMAEKKFTFEAGGGEKPNIEDVSAPTHLDGTPVDKEEAANMHAKLVSGEMNVLMADGMEEQLAEMGLTADDIRQMLIAAAKKTMS
jgi:hypothetical protein